MKLRVAHLLIALALLSAGARAAAAADEADTAVIAAVLRFIDALEAADAKTLEQMISIIESPTQEQARKTFVDLAVAQKNLEKTAIAKFGDEGKPFRCGFELIASAADRKAIANAKVHWDDVRYAHLLLPGEVSWIAVRRNPENQWQVTLETVENEEEPENHFYPPLLYPQPGQLRSERFAAIKAKRNAAVLEAFRSTAARIESGELSNAAAAYAELLGKLTAASTEAAKARAAIPSRWKDRQQ